VPVPSKLSPAPSLRAREEPLKYHIATLRQRLSSLVAADTQPAERLVDGSGVHRVAVRLARVVFALAGVTENVA
jgi:hypothetical protein